MGCVERKKEEEEEEEEGQYKRMWCSGLINKSSMTTVKFLSL